MQKLKKIHSHWQDPVDKTWKFRCEWKGYGAPKDQTVEPATSFVHGYTGAFRRYLEKHKIPLELSECFTKKEDDKEGAKADHISR